MTPESICGSIAPSMLPDGRSSEATLPESSLSIDIIVLDTTREKPSSITGFRPISSAGWSATGTALQLKVSSSVG